MNDCLQQLVLRRLGFESPPSADLKGLQAVYGAWCANVPFDNVRKTIALRSHPGRSLPGGSAAPFFEAWLDGGTGGTCWPTSNALFELLRSLGFQARRLTGSMHDLGIVNHASAEVVLEGSRWLVDSSLLSNMALPLNERVFVHADPVCPAEVEPDGPAHIVWSRTPPNSAWLPCRLNQVSATQADYLERYEESRWQSPFNQRLYARRNRPGELVMLVGRTRFSRTARGDVSRDFSPDELCEALGRDIGVSQHVIDEWVRSGCLDASFQPSSGPKAPVATRKPPSQRV